MPRKKLTPTTKAVGELIDLHDDGRLDLTPDYQRNSVWPTAAKAFLIDTMLRDMPIPLLFLARERDSNSGKLGYRVIDGQQRLRAAISFRQNRLSIPNQYGVQKIRGGLYSRIKYRNLTEELADFFDGYSFVVMELSGYSDAELRDIFLRINKYVVRLNLQEMRDASGPGPFRSLVDDVAGADIWGRLGVFSRTQIDRKRDKEFLAELLILMLEGPQDKKGSVDLYYAAKEEQLADTEETKTDLLKLSDFVFNLFHGEVPATLRKLPAFYGLVGAFINVAAEHGYEILRDQRQRIRETLLNFVATVDALPPYREDEPASEMEASIRRALAFRLSVSRQTDNVKPRTQRIEILEELIAASLA